MLLKNGLKITNINLPSQIMVVVVPEKKDEKGKRKKVKKKRKKVKKKSKK
jgi:hypothetical protein